MKEIILAIALQFSADFDKPIDNIKYRTGDLQHIATMSKIKGGYEIVIDAKYAKIASRQQLKTVVYLMTGKATGMDTTSTAKTFMNPKYIFKPYNKF